MCENNLIRFSYFLYTIYSSNVKFPLVVEPLAIPCVVISFNKAVLYEILQKLEKDKKDCKTISFHDEYKLSKTRFS